MKLRNKKTGKVIDLDYWTPYVLGNEIGFENEYNEEYHYNSLAELNEEWEDYESKEPLIKDKDVRNIIRYITSRYGSDQVYVTNFGMGDIRIKFSFKNAGSTYLCFTLNTGVHVPDGSYTITELCGEEE